MPVTIAAIADDQFETVLQAFNEGYEDYVVPFHLDATRLQAHLDSGSINLAASRMAYEDGRVIGIVLLGIRGERGWVGGVGVNKAWRGKGIGRQLMGAVIASGREQGLSVLQLEVIQTNTAAHNLYLSLGFQNTRRLLILERRPQALDTGSTANIRIESHDPAEVLARLAVLHTQPNPWQRQPDSLRPQLSRASGWIASQAGEPDACALAFAGENNIQWTDLACVAGHDEALRALTAHVHAMYPQATARMVNLPEDDPAWPVLSSQGYTETLAQYEMRLDL
jgi:ribosomal protein S18 acetylase RimI-like enzyme